VLGDEERREVVVGVGVVREPAQLVGGIDVGDAVVAVLHPFGGLQVHREQPVGLELALDRRVLVAGGVAVVVGVVLQAQLHRDLHARVLEPAAGPFGVGAAGAVAVHVLELGAGAGQALGDVGEQRGVGVVVHGAGDGLAVDEVGDRLADGAGLVGIRILGLLAVGVGVEVEDDVADLAAGALVDRHRVVALQVGDVGRGEGAPHAVDVALLDVELHVVL